MRLASRELHHFTQPLDTAVETATEFILNPGGGEITGEREPQQPGRVMTRQFIDQFMQHVHRVGTGRAEAVELIQIDTQRDFPDHAVSDKLGIHCRRRRLLWTQLVLADLPDQFTAAHNSEVMWPALTIGFVQVERVHDLRLTSPGSPEKRIAAVWLALNRSNNRPLLADWLQVDKCYPVTLRHPGRVTAPPARVADPRSVARLVDDPATPTLAGWAFGGYSLRFGGIGFWSCHCRRSVYLHTRLSS